MDIISLLVRRFNFWLVLAISNGRGNKKLWAAFTVRTFIAENFKDHNSYGFCHLQVAIPNCFKTLIFLREVSIFKQIIELNLEIVKMQWFETVTLKQYYVLKNFCTKGLRAEKTNATRQYDQMKVIFEQNLHLHQCMKQSSIRAICKFLTSKNKSKKIKLDQISWLRRFLKTHSNQSRWWVGGYIITITVKVPNYHQ